MADKEYSSIIDAILDERDPSWEDAGLADAEKSGKEQLDRTHQYVDEGFLDEIAEGSSRHTQLPSNSKSAVLLNRLSEKDAAAPRLGAGQRARTRLAARPEDYENERGSDESLFEEVTMSLGKAESEASVEKRNVTDEEVKRYVRDLLNQGAPPAKVAERLRKMGEIELLNKKDNMGMSYLNQNAGLLGLAYLEPNAYMPYQSPTYEREKVGGIGKRAMNIQPVTGPPFYAECIGCHERKVFGDTKGKRDAFDRPFEKTREGEGGGFADLEGEPFKAYYCNECAAGLRTASKTAESKKDPCPHCNKDVTPEKREGNHYCPECKKILTVKPKTGGDTGKTGTISVCPICKKTINAVRSTEEHCPNCGGLISYRKASSADCVRQHNAWKAAGIVPRAQSVKKVAACEGCAFFRDKTCNLYHLPVVSNAAELAPIVNRMTAGVPAKSKRAALIQIANREPQRAVAATPAPRPFAKTSQRTIENVRELRQEASAEFDPEAVEAMHKDGASLDEIYRKGSLKVGSVQAGRAVKAFVASLKEKGTKVALSQIDCKFLKGKLGIRNAIMGATKCADCTYRSDMHCGLTGGTLLAFPGMEKTGRKTASAPPEDAATTLREYDLVDKPEQADIDLNEDREGIEMGSKPSAGDL